MRERTLPRMARSRTLGRRHEPDLPWPPASYRDGVTPLTRLMSG
jgi:hypothetical protein